MGTALLLFAAVFAIGTGPCDELVQSWEVVEKCELGPVWSGHPVGFYLLTVPPYQYVAFYNAQRKMVIAGRKLGEKTFRFKQLPTAVGWDSHNGIVMAVDRKGCLHVSGNMHVDPLVYFRMSRPHDLDSLEPVHHMVGKDEDRVTYPRFLHTASGELIFYYRDGASGRGRQLFNIYDEESESWRRLLPTALLDGGERMSAYPSGPVVGPDHKWHLCWMWRDTPDCSTNHDISYARSPDLRHWETVDGKPLRLPITPETPGVVVDAVPSKRGLINMGHHVGFDGKGRPIVTYHKYDAAGRSQIFNARWERGCWVVHQTSNWDYRWEFGGGGSIPAEISAGPVQVTKSGLLTQKFHHKRYGSGIWILDEASLKPVYTCRVRSGIPREVTRLESSFPGMQVRVAWDSGSVPAGEAYLIKWETLPRNRDRPRPGPLPPPSMLRLYHLRLLPQLPEGQN